MPTIDVRIANQGNVPVENVTLQARPANGSTVGQFLGALASSSHRTVQVNLTEIRTGRIPVAVTVAFDAGDARHFARTETHVVSRSGAVALTGIEVDREGDHLHLSGSASNLGHSTVKSVVVSARDGATANATAAAVRDAINRRERRVTVFELVTIREQIAGFFDAVDAFLFGVGAVSLVVAGVSILNVMLLSTAERQGEIGLLRAVGYRRRDVLWLLLAEAGLLGVAGALLGVVAGLGIGIGVATLAFDDPAFAVDPRNVTHLTRAGVVGIAVSLAGGAYPVWKAATARPVDALRG